MFIDSCWDDDDGLAPTLHVLCTQLLTYLCMLLCMYIGCMIIIYYRGRYLVSLTADFVMDGSRYDGYGYSKVTSVTSDTAMLV